MTNATIANRLVEKLKKWGAYVYYHARTGSIYVKFPHWALGSIRVADHNGRWKYRYRWNCVVDDYDLFEIKKDRGIDRLFFGTNRIEKFVALFEQRAAERGVSPGDKEAWEDRPTLGGFNDHSREQGRQKGSALRRRR